MGASLGFGSTDLTLLATAISEVARNVTTYAGEGEVALRVVHERGPRRHRGPSARTRARASPNVELAMQDGYTTGQRARARPARHPAARRRVRAARPRTGEGTTDPAREVGEGLGVPDRTSPDWPDALERGIAERALAGRDALRRLRGLRDARGRRARRGDRRPRARRRGGRRRRARGRRASPGIPDEDPVLAARALPRGAAQHARRGDDRGLVRPRRRAAALDGRRQRRGPARPRGRRAVRGRVHPRRGRRLQPARHAGDLDLARGRRRDRADHGRRRVRLRGGDRARRDAPSRSPTGSSPRTPGRPTTRWSSWSATALHWNAR